jgi:hypothetical protein
MPKRRGIRMRTKTILLLAICVLFSFLIAESKNNQTVKWKGKIEKKDGIIIVKNPKKPLYGKEIFSIEEELKIGEAEGDENYMFSQIRNIAIDKNENIYVADYKETNVKVFDKNGEFLRVFGKEGQGPGEIGRISSIQITAKNELLINDSRNRRILYFSLEGKFLRSKNIGEIWSLRLYCDSNENYYFITAFIEPPNSRYELLKYDSEMNLIATIAKVPAPDPAKPLDPFMPTIYCQVLDNDCLLYGYPESYELQIFNPECKVIKKIIRKYDPVRISEAEKEEALKNIPFIPPGYKIEFKRYHTAFSYFKMDDQGRIFVQTPEKPDSGEKYSFDVFDSEGRYIARIPLNFRPQVLKKGKIYTREEDEEGYQFVKRYKVTWRAIK